MFWGCRAFRVLGFVFEVFGFLRAFRALGGGGGGWGFRVFGVLGFFWLSAFWGFRVSGLLGLGCFGALGVLGFWGFRVFKALCFWDLGF